LASNEGLIRPVRHAVGEWLLFAPSGHRHWQAIEFQPQGGTVRRKICSTLDLRSQRVSSVSSLNFIGRCDEQFYPAPSISRLLGFLRRRGRRATAAEQLPSHPRSATE
jgi:hypothetical protein